MKQLMTRCDVCREVILHPTPFTRFAVGSTMDLFARQIGIDPMDYDLCQKCKDRLEDGMHLFQRIAPSMGQQ